jgi:hypothetical protein
MATQTQRIVPRRYETLLRLQDYFSLNKFGPHQTHKPGELLTFDNCDLFSGYVQSRKGSAAHNGIANRLRNRRVLSGLEWDTGAQTYAVLQLLNVALTGSEFWTIPLGVGAVAFTQIPALALATTEQADMHISNDRCYVFSPAGNIIIEFDAGTFSGRSMGLPQPFMGAALPTFPGVLTGKYTYGVELVYQDGGVDLLASSPCRQIVGSRIINTITVANTQVRIGVASGVLIANTLWTHARLYRSKNQNIDYTEPANPLDAQGLPEELYSIKTVDRATFEANSYTFDDDNLPDADIPATAFFLELNRIDLEPLPAAYVGVEHRGRIFVSRMQGIDDITQANIGYSNGSGTKYSEQWDPDQIIHAEPGDGQQTVKLIGLDRDLIVIKEAKTGRVMDGNPDNGFETLDHRIGISHKRMAAHIPSIGIAAITNDQGDFRIFTPELRWTNQWGGQDISKYLRNETAAANPTYVSFAYLNGKLLMSMGTGTVFALHVEQNKGWTRYPYPMLGIAELMFTFANGSRALIVRRDSPLIEIEMAGVDTDYRPFDDAEVPIMGEMTTHRFQSNGGRDVLTARFLSIIADLKGPLFGIPYGNGLPWPGGQTAVGTAFIIDPSVDDDMPALTEREYRLFLEDKLICNYIHYVLQAEAPFTIHDMALDCIVTETSGGGSFDPYGVLQFASTFPLWASDILLYLTFDKNAAKATDASGHGRHHTYGALGVRTWEPGFVPGDGQDTNGAAGSGWTDTSWDGMDYIGDAAGFNSADLGYEYVLAFPSLASAVTIEEGGDGTYYWRIKVNTDGSLEHQIKTSALAYKFKTAAAVIVAGSNQYTIQFALSNGGMNGQFYCSKRVDPVAELLTTRTAL